MSRYAAMFERTGRAGEGALGAFVMLGDPDLVTSAAILDALVESGADMLEVGIPFSDPVADGPVIQAAASRAGASPPQAATSRGPADRDGSATADRLDARAPSPQPISTDDPTRAASSGRPPSEARG